MTVIIQGLGERRFPSAAGSFMGTRGQGLRLEAFQFEFRPPLEGLGAECMAVVEGIGSTGWLPAGVVVGAAGQSKCLHGFGIRLTGPLAPLYTVRYLGHFQSLGDTEVQADGALCGPMEHARRCEGMQVLIKLRGL